MVKPSPSTTKPHHPPVPLSFTPWLSLSERTRLLLSYLFMLAVVVEASFLYVQWYEIISAQAAKNVSVPAFLVLLGMNVIWLGYAIFVAGSWPICLSGVLYMVGSAGVAFSALHYEGHA